LGVVGRVLRVAGGEPTGGAVWGSSQQQQQSLRGAKRRLLR